jgi:hypothetical protein
VTAVTAQVGTQPLGSRSNIEIGSFEMFELAAFIVAGAVALTFFSDATSGTMKMVRAARRRGSIRVADHH